MLPLPVVPEVELHIFVHPWFLSYPHYIYIIYDHDFELETSEIGVSQNGTAPMAQRYNLVNYHPVHSGPTFCWHGQHFDPHI